MSQRENIARALRKLVYMGKWEGNHASFDNLPKGFPSHLRGEVKKVARELIKAGLLLSKPTSYGTEVSLNIKMKKEIEKFS